MKTRSVLVVVIGCLAAILLIAFLIFMQINGGSVFGSNHYVKVGLVPEPGMSIAGRYYAPGKVEDRGVILLHMLGGSQNDWNDFAQQLQAQHFAVMTLDFRGHGESSGNWKTMTDVDFNKLVDDAAEAIEYLHDINSHMRMAVVGASIGANVAMQLADQSEAVTSVVLLSPSTNYHGVDITAINQTLAEPILYVSSQDDEQSFVPTQQLYDASPSTDKVFKTYKQGGHGTKLLQHTPALHSAIIDWLNQHLSL